MMNNTNFLSRRFAPGFLGLLAVWLFGLSPVLSSPKLDATSLPASPATTVRSVELDIDGDGDLDYVVESGRGFSHHRIEIWLNLGSNRWRSQGLIETAIATPDLMVVDINHDGYGDLVIRDQNWQLVPEVWVGGKHGSLEKARSDLPLSLSGGRDEAIPAGPLDVNAALLSDSASRIGPQSAGPTALPGSFPGGAAAILLFRSTLNLCNVPPAPAPARGPPVELLT